MELRAEPLVDTVIEDPRWDVLGLGALAEAAGQATLAHLGLPASGFTLCVMGCDDARMAVLNGEFRARGVPTNVLSWPSEDRAPDDLPLPGPADNPEELGDIAIAYDTCTREAVDQGKPLAHHVSHLIVHATLHLLGYDHVDDADATLMEGTEVAVLAKLGVGNPY